MKRRLGVIAVAAVSLLAIGIPLAGTPAQACAWRWTGSSYSCL